MKIFIQENAFKNVVCKMSSILFRYRCVKSFIRLRINILAPAGSHPSTHSVTDVCAEQVRIRVHTRVHIPIIHY